MSNKCCKARTKFIEKLLFSTPQFFTRKVDLHDLRKYMQIDSSIKKYSVEHIFFIRMFKKKDI